MMVKKVLIIEDNQLNMKLFHDLLKNQGYEIITSYEGKGALDLVLRNMPDVIVMDIQLPEVSGLDVIRELKSNNTVCSIPIIAVTAFAMKGDEEKIRATGCDGYISKPVSIVDFVSTVNHFLQ